MGSWEKSLDDLIAGNERFVNGTFCSDRSYDAQRRNLLEEGQHPLAIVVCTSDSYMPPELVFDADLGDLYVMRMPDLEVNRSVLEGISFAVEKLAIPLCVILTHEARKGDPETEEEGFWQSLLRSNGEDAENEEEVIKSCVQKVRDYAPLEGKIERGEFFVVGAKYDLESGSVTIFDFLSE